MTEEQHMSAAQAVQDVSSAILKAAGECMTLHGPDPNSPAILAAAFVMAIRNITEHIDPGFQRRLMIQLGAST